MSNKNKSHSGNRIVDYFLGINLSQDPAPTMDRVFKGNLPILDNDLEDDAKKLVDALTRMGNKQKALELFYKHIADKIERAFLIINNDIEFFKLSEGKEDLIQLKLELANAYFDAVHGRAMRQMSAKKTLVFNHLILLEEDPTYTTKKTADAYFRSLFQKGIWSEDLLERKQYEYNFLNHLTKVLRIPENLNLAFRNAGAVRKNTFSTKDNQVTLDATPLNLEEAEPYFSDKGGFVKQDELVQVDPNKTEGLLAAYNLSPKLSLREKLIFEAASSTVTASLHRMTENPELTMNIVQSTPLSVFKAIDQDNHSLKLTDPKSWHLKSSALKNIELLKRSYEFDFIAQSIMQLRKDYVELGRSNNIKKIDKLLTKIELIRTSERDWNFKVQLALFIVNHALQSEQSSYEKSFFKREHTLKRKMMVDEKAYHYPRLLSLTLSKLYSDMPTLKNLYDPGEKLKPLMQHVTLPNEKVYQKYLPFLLSQNSTLEEFNAFKPTLINSGVTEIMAHRLFTYKEKFSKDLMKKLWPQLKREPGRLLEQLYNGDKVPGFEPIVAAIAVIKDHNNTVQIFPMPH